MNFKTVNATFLLLIFCLTYTSCGVKSPPSAPPGTEIPSYLDNFLKTPPEKENAEKNKEEKKEE